MVKIYHENDQTGQLMYGPDPVLGIKYCYVTHDDYDKLEAENKRLRDKVARLRMDMATTECKLYKFEAVSDVLSQALCLAIQHPIESVTSDKWVEIANNAINKYNEVKDGY